MGSDAYFTVLLYRLVNNVFCGFNGDYVVEIRICGGNKTISPTVSWDKSRDQILVHVWAFNAETQVPKMVNNIVKQKDFFME